MAQNDRPDTARRSRLLAGVTWYLTVSFIVGGLVKFAPGETFFGSPYSERFVDWGYPGWFRFLVGAGEIVGGLLLISRRGRFAGASLLVAILVGAVLTHIANQDPLSESVSAPVHLVLAAGVAWTARPRAVNAVPDPAGRGVPRRAAASG
jgi:uncharacterized membrane protein YphA (DoxX/SURF4 family)